MNVELAVRVLELSMFGPDGVVVASGQMADEALADVEAAMQTVPASDPSRRAILAAADRLRDARSRQPETTEAILDRMGEDLQRARRDDERFHAEVARLTEGIA